MPPICQRKKRLWFFLAILFLFGCVAIPGTTIPAKPGPPSPPPPPWPTSGPDSPATALPLPTPSPTLTPAPRSPSLPEHTQYRITAVVDYTQHRVAAEQTIRYRNDTGLPLDELLLVVPSTREDRGFQLSQLSREDSIPIETRPLNGPILLVSLGTPLLPDEEVILHLTFQLDLPQQPSPFGYTRRQLNLGSWYPYVPPYDPEEGWLAYQPSQVGEVQVFEMATFEVELTLAGSDPDLVVAASSPAKRAGNSFIFQPVTARNFSLSISPDFQIATGKVGDVEVKSYYFPETKPAGEAVLQTSLQALEVYSETFGAYYHPSLTAVEADFPDGMEFDGLYFLGQKFYWSYTGDPQNYLTILSAHETAHQWWGGMVGNNQAMEPWLDEALATYSELIFFEKVYPANVDWWWQFRVNYYNPEEGSVNDPVYKYGSFRPYVNAVYLRGAMFLEGIREAMGRETFLQMLSAYTQMNQLQIATADDFWEAIRLYWDGDLKPVQDRYFSTDSIGQ